MLDVNVIRLKLNVIRLKLNIIRLKLKTILFIYFLIESFILISVIEVSIYSKKFYYFKE